MEMYNDAFLRWKELKRHSGCLSDLQRGHPESSVSGFVFWEGIKIWRGNGQLHLNVSYWLECWLHSEGGNAEYQDEYLQLCDESQTQPTASKWSSQIKQTPSGHLMVQFHREKDLKDMKPVICSVDY